MKKIYMAPQTEIIKIEALCMLDGSVGGKEEELEIGGGGDTGSGDSDSKPNTDSSGSWIGD